MRRFAFLPVLTLVLERMGVDMAQMLTDAQFLGIGPALVRVGLGIGLRMAGNARVLAVAR